MVVEDRIAKIDARQAGQPSDLEITDGECLRSHDALEVGAIAQVHGAVRYRGTAKNVSVGFDQAKGRVCGQQFAQIGEIGPDEHIVCAEKKPSQFCERGQYLPRMVHEIFLVGSREL